MKNRFIKFIAIVCCLSALAATGTAQAADRTEFQVPFDFTVNKQVFPAGRYTIERLNQTNPDLLVLKQFGGELKTIVQTQRITSDRELVRTQLTFNRGSEGYFLTEIWEVGSKYGSRILTDEIQ